MEKINNHENISQSRLEKPSSLYKDSFIEAMEEFINEESNPDVIPEGQMSKEKVNEIKDNFDNFLLKVHEKENGSNLPDGRVPASLFWLINKKEYIGRVQIRHKLNESLSILGGHIGYAIRPTKRKMGYGDKVLELGLIEAKKLGLNKVFLTCDDSNIGSYKIIEKNGGILQDKININGKLERRYWIEIK